MKKLNGCTKERDTLNSVTPNELSAVSGAKFFLDIDKNSNLNGIYFSDAKENYSASVNLRIEEGSENLTIAAPSGAKPVTDLATDIVKLTQSITSLSTSLQAAE